LPGTTQCPRGRSVSEIADRFLEQIATLKGGALPRDALQSDQANSSRSPGIPTTPIAQLRRWARDAEPTSRAAIDQFRKPCRLHGRARHR